MKLPKNIWIVVTALIAVTMVGVSGFLLVRGVLLFNESEAKLGLAKKRLQQMYDRNPFPDKSNIETEKHNAELATEWFNQLMGSLRKGQVDPVQVTPATFMSMLQSKKPELIGQANSGTKVVAEDFGFGFERYFSSSMLPEPTDVPRLTQQLAIVDKLCAVLFAQKIDELSSIQREIFESGGDVVDTAGAGRPSRRGATTKAVAKFVNKNAGIFGEEDLFTKFHFALEFKAKQAAVWDVLNKLAANEMFIVVTSLDVETPGSDIADIKAKTPALTDDKRAASKAAAPDAASAAGAVEKPLIQKPEEKPPKEARIVCGPVDKDKEKPVSVKMELDVYRFRGE